MLPAGYVIGPSDVLSIVFWRDKDMSADVTVRPDGKISLPLLNEVTAGGYTPEQLRVRLVEAAKGTCEDPNATVVGQGRSGAGTCTSPATSRSRRRIR